MAKIGHSNLSHQFNLLKKKLESIFLKSNTHLTPKKDIDFKNVAIVFFSLMIIFVIYGLFLPTEEKRSFRIVSHETQASNVNSTNEDQESKESNLQSSRVSNVWGSGVMASSRKSVGSQVNYNTAMVLGPKTGNARNEIHSGTRLRLQIMDKVIASKDGVPVLARLIESVTSESGNNLSEGTLFYGEARYQTSGRAQVEFKRISLPSGQFRIVSAVALGSDGMEGVEGKVQSDSARNSVGQVLTTFVGGLAAGSVERDVMGNSRGGIGNGLLMAFAEATKDRAQKYGESLKETREWIEIPSGFVFEARINQPYQFLQDNQLSNQGEAF
ncbi:MAG: hypothetical protein BroJett040_00650 [Oligoflexia bacterium]|nr:MAG: hypothetical protein BroJett040_00650 [Oligoflexia bacterium]